MTQEEEKKAQEAAANAATESGAAAGEGNNAGDGGEGDANGGTVTPRDLRQSSPLCGNAEKGRSL